MWSDHHVPTPEVGAKEPLPGEAANLELECSIADRIDVTPDGEVNEILLWSAVHSQAASLGEVATREELQRESKSTATISPKLANRLIAGPTTIVRVGKHQLQVAS